MTTKESKGRINNTDSAATLPVLVLMSIITSISK